MKRFLSAVILLLLASTAQSQSLGINDTGLPADASSILDVTSTSKGMLVPRMTSAQRSAISSPAPALLIYQTDGVSGYYYNAGTSVTPNWIYLLASNSSLSASNINGTVSITNGGTGATNATAAINNLLPSQTGQSGKFLTTNGTSASWATGGSSGPALQFMGTITNSPSFTATSASTLIYNNAITNLSTQMNTSSGVFTAASAGLYSFNASTGLSGSGVRMLVIRVNGSDVFVGSTGTGSTTFPTAYNTASYGEVSGMYPLAAGDQVTIALITNSVATTVVNSGFSRLVITKLN